MMKQHSGVSSSGWVVSSYSNGYGACLEVKYDTDSSTVLVRDSKWSGDSAEQPQISMPAELWNGVAERLAAPQVVHTDDGGFQLISDGVVLDYTPAEAMAYRKGWADGEFNLVPVSA